MGFMMHDLINLVENSVPTTGDKIRFERYEDALGDDNRGWQSDIIKVYINGEDCGLIKASYIPTDRWKKYYPTIFNYMSQQLGKHVLSFENKTAKYTELTDEELREKVYYIASESMNWSSSNKMAEKAKTMSHEELLSWYKAQEEHLNKKYGKQFKRFKQYTYNFPSVSYIDVNKNWRRRGLGRALYLEMALWMREKGMKLYADKLQSDSAAATWQKMDSEGMVGHNDNGRYIITPDN